MKLAGAYIDKAKYDALAKQAKTNFRTLADHCRFIFDQALSGKNLPSVNRKPAKKGAAK